MVSSHRFHCNKGSACVALEMTIVETEVQYTTTCRFSKGPCKLMHPSDKSEEDTYRYVFNCQTGIFGIFSATAGTFGTQT